LLSKALSATASHEELQELAEIVKNDKGGSVTELIENTLQKAGNAHGSLPDKATCDAMVDRILQTDKQGASINKKPAAIFRFNRRMIAAAAAIIIVLGAGMLLWVTRTPRTGLANKEMLAVSSNNDAAPGHNQAILKLADGSTIVLDSAGNGMLAQQGNTRVLKSDNGQLTYVPAGSAQEPILYNTVITPRGGQYQLVLPDGTKVWLNAASSLRFPTKFTGTERDVELDGEGYFEVAKNAAMPFEVKMHGNTSVRVLGTHFNIMAYGDENAIKTTLLEGAVKVTKGENSQTLKPGQQAVLDNNSNKLQVIENADMDEAVAWKNGYFQFGKIDAQAMRQISRWYDVDLVYEGSLKEKGYTGRIDRNVKLSNVAHALEIIDVHCRIEKGKLIVTP
jgi:ferric-dicitrate binding protein FerR (iron transport regulator)